VHAIGAVDAAEQLAAVAVEYVDMVAAADEHALAARIDRQQVPAAFAAKRSVGAHGVSVVTRRFGMPAGTGGCKGGQGQEDGNPAHRFLREGGGSLRSMSNLVPGCHAASRSTCSMRSP